MDLEDRKWLDGPTVGTTFELAIKTFKTVKHFPYTEDVDDLENKDEFLRSNGFLQFRPMNRLLLGEQFPSSKTDYSWKVMGFFSTLLNILTFFEPSFLFRSHDFKVWAVALLKNMPYEHSGKGRYVYMYLSEHEYVSLWVAKCKMLCFQINRSFFFCVIVKTGLQGLCWKYYGVFSLLSDARGVTLFQEVRHKGQPLGCLVNMVHGTLLGFGLEKRWESGHEGWSCE